MTGILCMLLVFIHIAYPFVISFSFLKTALLQFGLYLYHTVECNLKVFWLSLYLYLFT